MQIETQVEPLAESGSIVRPMRRSLDLKKEPAMQLTPTDIRSSALALAESARKRTRGEDPRASRKLAAVLEEAYPVAVARGAVTISLSQETLWVLAESLRGATGRYGRPDVSFRALARRLEA